MVEDYNDSKRDSIIGSLAKIRAGNLNYTILGDSITDAWNGHGGSGGGASDSTKGYAAIVERWLKNKYGNGITFTNNGTGGYDTADTLLVLQSYILSQNYDLVCIALGTNDWNGQVQLDVFEANYESIITQIIEDTNSEIMLIGLGYFDTWKKPEKPYDETLYNNVIKKLAKKYNLMYMDTYDAMKAVVDRGIYTFAEITLEQDPVHPNDIGHTIWAGQLFKILND